jgi:glyoxylase-like metal-dependent hydrolase (beta-lactamase superfamily II)
VRHVPGHCPGSVLFWCETEGVAFSGDAIFEGSVGRTDFPGGSMALLEKSIREQIYSLPDATELYPGHGDATTVAREKAINPFVRC